MAEGRVYRVFGVRNPENYSKGKGRKSAMDNVSK